MIGTLHLTLTWARSKQSVYSNLLPVHCLAHQQAQRDTCYMAVRSLQKGVSHESGNQQARITPQKLTRDLSNP